MFEGPAADAGAVGLEVQAALEFTGGGAGGGGRLGGQEFGEEGGHFGGPIRLGIAARQAGGPGCGLALGAGEQGVRAPLIVAADAEAQFQRDRFGRETAGAGLGKEMTDERRGNTVNEWVRVLKFFLARTVAGRWI
jgi:hypothetical protein